MIELSSQRMCGEEAFLVRIDEAERDGVTDDPARMAAWDTAARRGGAATALISLALAAGTALWTPGGPAGESAEDAALRMRLTDTGRAIVEGLVGRYRDALRSGGAS